MLPHTITISLLSSLAIMAATETLPLANPDFEQGLDSWQNGNTMCAAVPAAAHNGRLGLRITDDNPNAGSSLRSQPLHVIPGRVYCLRFWAHVPLNTAGKFGIYMDFCNAQGKRLMRANGQEFRYELTCVPEWRQLTYVETAPPDAVTVSLWIHSYNATTNLVADLDNFVFTMLSEEEAMTTTSTVISALSPFPKPAPQRIQKLEAMLPEQLWQPGRPIDDRAAWERLAADPASGVIIKRAEKILSLPPPAMTDESYLIFSKTGSRVEYEAEYHRWEPEIQTLTVAECMENHGRFLPEIIRRLEDCCQARSWLMPAHDSDLTNFHNTLLYPDLGCCARGFTIMTVDAWLGPRLSPALRLKLRQEIQRRILDPYLEAVRSGLCSKGLWWMYGTNNWTAVCTCEIVGIALAFVPDRHVRAEILAAMEISNRFYLSGFSPDGYCTEGVSYWNYGFGHFMAMVEIVLQATDGKLNILQSHDSQLLERVSRFGTDILITDTKAPTFADCRLDIVPMTDLLILIQKHLPQSLHKRVHLNSPLGHTMPGFQFDFNTNTPVSNITFNLILERIPCFALLGFADQSPYEKALPQDAPLPEHSFFPEAGVLVCRPGKQPHQLSLAIKGGHNNEHHNHNDIGSFIVLNGDTPYLTDPGREEYSGQTFGSARYTFDLMNSHGHSVPRVAGQLQRPGQEARGRVLSTDFTHGHDHYVLDLADAYSVNTLKSLTRTLDYDRLHGIITITDDVSFTSPQDFESALVSFMDFQQTAPDAFAVKDSHGGLSIHISVSGAEWTAQSTVLKTVVKHSPHRLGIALKHPAIKARITFTISTL